MVKLQLNFIIKMGESLKKVKDPLSLKFIFLMRAIEKIIYWQFMGVANLVIIKAPLFG